MSDWIKETRRLRKGHGWIAGEGCKIFVADRGAVGFQYPEAWVVRPDSDSIKIHDRTPPDDDCTLAVSYLRLPRIDWRGLPLASLVEAALEGDPREFHHRGEIVDASRRGVEIAWRELLFVDPRVGLDARSRLALARRGGVQALITMEFWETDAARVEPVWDLVLDTLELDRHIEDPTRGPTLH